MFVGDGNNVARSMAVGCGLFGLRFILAAPDGYKFDDAFVQMFHQVAPKGELILNGEPGHAVGQADIIYTDVWTSMGQEAERDERRRKFAPFQVNEKLMALAPPHARVMHCLPAVRGEEVSDERPRRRPQHRVPAGREPHARPEGASDVAASVGNALRGVPTPGTPRRAFPTAPTPRNATEGVPYRE